MDRVSILPNQRVGIPDYEDGAGGRLVQEDQHRENRTFLLPSGRQTGGAVTSARLFSGWDWETITFDTDDSATLNRGAGIFPVLDDDGTLIFGQLAGDEGVASVILDFSGASPSSTQAVYIRAVSTLGSFENRVFWNPDASPSAAELTDNVSTRRLAAWQAVFQDTSAPAPGNGEYVKIWDVVMNGASKITSVTDYRHLYFEGDVNGSFAHEWGDGANDRSATRETYGITDNHMFVQAVRRQLADILGVPWYTAAPDDLTELNKINNRFVTVTQGAFTGHYATLDAAITALNAGNGGTILLKSGTYTATEINLTKRINIIAMENSVKIEGDADPGDYGITYSAGSEGSAMRGVEIAFGAASSDFQLMVNADRIRFEQCVIEGQIRVDDAMDVVFDECRLHSDAVTAASASATVYISGTSTLVRVAFRRCVLEGGTLDNVFRAFGVAASTTDGTSDVAFSDCKFLSDRGVQCVNVSASEINLNFRSCSFFIETPSSGDPGISLTSGNTSITDCVITHEDASADWTDSLISTSLPGDSHGLKINNLVVDCTDILPKHTTNGTAPISLSGDNLDISQLEVLNCKLPNTATAPSAANFVYIFPNTGTGNQLTLKNSRFHRISSEGSGDIDCNFLAISGGACCVEGCIFDGVGSQYRTSTSDANFVDISSSRSTLVKNNLFEGGTWSDVLSIVGTSNSNAIVTDNSFMFIDSTTDLDRIVVIEGPAPTTKDNIRVVFSGNIILRLEIDGLSAVRIAGARRVSIIGNIDSNNETTAPADGSIYVRYVEDLIVYGNNLDDGMATADISTQLPAGLGSDNIIT
jgi:hypothetical protein